MPLLCLSEVAIQLRETEGPVNLRAGELQPVFREQNALLLAGRTAILVADIDALFLYSLFQFVPVPAFWQAVLERTVDLVPGSVGLA